ncbi:hypothetical protein [Methylobacterium oryzihabitans]|uniref:Uncharacterized protein n=1 Tax=Methylobacterium oryzihabitans TaxID=2499852 RepID=A0A437PAJ2_9HYPH|nr:hypothetical protein [Methylobacterium oryzihabitans]RVU19128.1 hypothetical protein EOE48_09575 [Methylobacterium oryzihabitans]
MTVHQTPAAFTLPPLSPLQAAIRQHRVALARLDAAQDLDAEEEPEAGRLAREAEVRAWAALMAAPCLSRADAASLVAHVTPSIEADPCPDLCSKLVDALAAVLKADRESVAGEEGEPSPITLAIRAHEAARRAQEAASRLLESIAPAGLDASSRAVCEAEEETSSLLQQTPCGSLADATALLAYLRSVLADAPDLSTFDRAVFMVRVADLGLFVGDQEGEDAGETSGGLTDAIAAHRRAWEVFAAMGGPEGGEAHDAGSRLLEMPCGCRTGAEAMRAHLRWFLPELEAAGEECRDGAAGYEPELKARLRELELFLAGPVDAGEEVGRVVNSGRG